MTPGNLTLTPYLFFGGNCREAMEFYKTVFGGELTLSTFGEGPADAHQDPEANSDAAKDKIMHARLEGAVVLLASDNPHFTNAQNTGQFSLSLEGTDEKQLTAYFEKLAEKGQITVPLTKQFWGATFGMVTDQYGVNWMININNQS
jgi:PhnB protein